jgi:hypothetical protein
MDGRLVAPRITPVHHPDRAATITISPQTRPKAAIAHPTAATNPAGYSYLFLACVLPLELLDEHVEHLRLGHRAALGLTAEDL